MRALSKLAIVRLGLDDKLYYRVVRRADKLCDDTDIFLHTGLAREIDRRNEDHVPCYHLVCLGS